VWLSHPRWGEITLADGAALLVRDRVVQVAASGRAAADGEAAGGVAGADEPGQGGAGPVAGLAAPVVTRAGGQRLGGEGDGPAGGRGWLAAGGAAAGAGGEGVPVGVGEGDLPAGGGVGGGAPGQGAGGGGVDRPGAGHLAGRLGQSLQGGQRHGEVDDGPDRRQPHPGPGVDVGWSQPGGDRRAARAAGWSVPVRPVLGWPGRSRRAGEVEVSWPSGYFLCTQQPSKVVPSSCLMNAYPELSLSVYELERRVSSSPSMRKKSLDCFTGTPSSA
jgi:hypothetical protein